MTYQQGQQNNRLAEKLRGEFLDRGVAVSGMQATSTPELMKRAQSGSNPRVNVSEQEFDERYRKRTAGSSANHTGANPYGANKTQSTGNGQRTYSNQQRAKATAKNSAPHTEARKEAPAIVEKKLRYRQKLQPKYIIWLLIVTASLSLLVVSCIQNYNADMQISVLEDSIDDLKDSINDLELKLDEKNDIKMIETIATEKLGMVKEDTLERNYVSLSDGEHIDLVEDTTEAETSGLGTMLSALASVFGDLLEYIK